MKKKNLWPALLVLFLVAFPKGGIKVGDVPLTIGYAVLFMVAFGATFKNAAAGRYQALPRRNVLAYFSTLPLLAVSALIFVFNGTTSNAYAIAYFVGFAALPLIFLIALAPQFSSIDREVLHGYIRRAVNFAAVYGIVLFFWLLATNSFIEIPYLTVNVDDVGQLLADKNIQRSDGVYKLISTYNNGNIYGVAILMLLPNYDRTQKSKLWRLIVRASLVLTLSRTVWMGMVAYELLSVFYIGPLRWRTLLQLVAGISFLGGIVLYVLSLIGLDSSFLFDANLGGRTDIVNATQWLLVPEKRAAFSSEIIIVNIVGALGVVGLLAFLLACLMPIWLAATTGGREAAGRSSNTVRCYVTGMAMLMVCGLSDGPILLIPTMAFYWALAALALTQRSQNTIALKPESILALA